MNLPENALKTAFDACKKAFAFVGVFSFFINALILTVPLYMLQIFDRVLASQHYETLVFLTILAIFALIVFGLLDMCRGQILIYTANWLDKKLGPIAFSKTPDQLLLGNKAARQSLPDLTNLRTFLSSPTLMTLFDLPWAPVFILVIFLLHPILGILATFGAIVLFSIALLNQYLTKKLLDEANESLIQSNAHTQSTLNNAEVIQAMGMLPAIITRWQASNEIGSALASLAAKRTGMLLSASKSIRMILQVLMLATGAYLVVTNQLTAGGMIAGSILMSRALAPIEQGLTAWKSLMTSRQAYLRLKKFFDFPEVRTSTMPLPAPKGLISIEKMYYRLPQSNKFILEPISLNIGAGELVSIIGPSAAGKTSLARLIVGALKPTEGFIRLDNADVFTWERESFGKHIGYLPQSIELFSGTVSENIARMEEPEPQAVIEASKIAGVHDLILQFSDGYDTFLLDQGRQLSGGQRQRIALARALYKRPRVLVLDEPNASLDEAGFSALKNAVAWLKKEKVTTILITHNKELLDLMDKIMVLHSGKVMLYGNKTEVFNQLQSQRLKAAHAQTSQTSPGV